ncbi:MAG: oxidoreductase [Bryobacteraceae bacterium]
MSPKAKPRFATVWLAGCSGCHMSFLDLDERLIDLAGLVDVCYSPVVDAKEFPEHVDIALVEGAVANEDNLREIRKIRERTKVLVAFGDCAVTGNVTALRNLFRLEDVLDRSYRENSAVISGLPLGGDGIIPKLLERVRRIEDIVKVDYFLPGCPPSADVIYAFVSELLAGRAPAPEGRKFGT